MKKNKTQTSRAAISVQVALLSVACLAPAVVRLGGGGQLSTVDLASLLLGVSGLIAGCLLVLNSDTGLPPKRLSVAGLAVLGAGLVSLSLSGRPWSAFVGEASSMLGFAAMVSMALVAWSAYVMAGELRVTLSRCGHWVVLAESSLVFAQLVGFSGASGAGTLPNSTYLGELMLLLLPWVLPLDSRDSRFVKWARVLAVAFTLGALAGSGSRAALALAVLWTVWVVLRKGGIAKTLRARVLTLVVLAGFVVVLAFAFAGEEFRGSASIATLGERPQLWRLAVDAFTDRPVAGWGPDGYLAAGTAVSTVERAAGRSITLVRESIDPHSLPLWIAVSMGLLGLASAAWFSFEAVRRWVRLGREGVDVAPGVWSVCGVVFVLLTAPAAVQVLPLLALVFGVSIASTRPVLSVSGGRKRWQAVLVVAFAFMSLVLALNSLTRWSFELSSEAVNPSRAVAAQAASDFWRLDGHMAYLSSVHWSFAGVNAPSSDTSGRSLAVIGRALQVDSHNPQYALEQARILWFTDAPEEQVDQAFARAFERYPAYPLARAEYALFLAQSGRVDEAEENLSVAKSSNDSDPERVAAVAAAEEEIEAAR